MSFLVPISLLGWVFVAVFLFAVLPPRRAILVAYIAAWLFLPVSAVEIPGLPDITKITATSLGAFAGIILFDAKSLTAFRPSVWDLPAFLWVTAAPISSLINGYGPYDALSSILEDAFIWGMPYLAGRLYFTSLTDVRELAIAIFIGGLVYVPLCLFELRFSPQCHNLVYGFHPSHFAMTVRYGGYRPMVFMQHGLMCGMWMASAALIGVWLWYSRSFAKIYNFPAWLLALVQLAVTIACKSSGAITLLVVGLVVLFAARFTRLVLIIIVFALLPPAYMFIRTNQWWHGEEIVQWAHGLDAERGASVLGRMENEDRLSAKALQKPLYGWGGWDAWRVFDPYSGKDITVADGMWVITMGQTGLVGLGSVTALTLLPIFLLLRRVPIRFWHLPGGGSPAVLAVLLVLFTIDNILNNMYNPIYILCSGSLIGFYISFNSRKKAALDLARRHRPSASRARATVQSPAGLLPTH